MKLFVAHAILIAAFITGCASNKNYGVYNANQVPDGMRFCSAKTQELFSSAPWGTEFDQRWKGSVLHIDEKRLQPCMKILKHEFREYAWVEAATGIAVSTNVEGHISDICIIRSNFGNAPELLSCLVDHVKNLQVTPAIQLEEAPYLIRWSIASR